MSETDGPGRVVCAIYVDMGTTNTRVWLLDGARVMARANRSVGVRDTAHDGSKARILAALAELIKEVRMLASTVSRPAAPACVVAAGMSSSPLGLAELPHTQAPTSSEDLAASSRWIELPDVTDLPILLVPGVRSGHPSAGPGSIDQTDVMRGEETLSIGLIALGLVRPPSAVLNLGSHWKAIKLDSEGKIASSITTLSGELIHAAQTQTVLAGSVTKERPGRIDRQWMEAGMREQRRSGLPRTLFCVRLLELAGEGTPEDRLAFMIGAFIAADLDLFIARGMLAYNTRAVIAGSKALAEAWRSALAGMSISAAALAPDEVDEALLTGLQTVLQSNQHGRL